MYFRALSIFRCKPALVQRGNFRPVGRHPNRGPRSHPQCLTGDPTISDIQETKAPVPFRTGATLCCRMRAPPVTTDGAMREGSLALSGLCHLGCEILFLLLDAFADLHADEAGDLCTRFLRGLRDGHIRVQRERLTD